MPKSLHCWYLRFRIRQRQHRIANLNDLLTTMRRPFIAEASAYDRIRNRIDDLAIENLLDNEKLNSLGG